MCHIEPDVYSTVWRDSPVKAARKRHRCDGCHGFIQIGESYVSHFSICEGDETHEKCCGECQKARDEFKKDHGWTMTPGSMHQFLTDCIEQETDFRWDAEGKRVDLPNDAALKWQAIKDQMIARRDAAAAEVNS